MRDPTHKISGLGSPVELPQHTAHRLDRYVRRALELIRVAQVGQHLAGKPRERPPVAPVRGHGVPAVVAPGAACAGALAAVHAPAGLTTLAAPLALEPSLSLGWVFHWQ